jgi:hypothetical protein
MVTDVQTMKRWSLLGLKSKWTSVVQLDEPQQIVPFNKLSMDQHQHLIGTYPYQVLVSIFRNIYRNNRKKFYHIFRKMALNFSKKSRNAIL